jgi:hypothetical protein
VLIGIMNTLNTPRCPVSGCTATKFGNVAIENEKPENGGHSLFVIQCQYGHIIGPNLMAELRGLLENQNKILAGILEKLEPRA